MVERPKDIEARARALAEPILAAEGIELVDVEYVHEHVGRVLRVYIDKPGGVSIDDCTLTSRALSVAFDVEDLVPHGYHLEVSSPGLNRPLVRPEHFQKARGQKVKVRTYAPLGEPPRKNFSGVLKEARPDAVMVEVEGQGEFCIPLRDIAKANLEYEF